MNETLRTKLDAFYLQSAISRPLPRELAELLESIRDLLNQVASLAELVPFGSRITQTHVDVKSTYDYLALIPSFPEDTSHLPTDLMRLFAGHLTQGLRSSFGVTVRAPTVRFWYRGEPENIMSIHPALYLVEHTEWVPGTTAQPPPVEGRKWLYPSGERIWSEFDHAARTKWIEQLDDATGGRLRRVIRLLKAWKYSSDVPVHSYFIECGVCDWLTRHANESLAIEDDLQVVYAVLSDLGVKVRKACDASRDVFITDPSGAVKPGLLSASTYDNQWVVAEQFENTSKSLAELLPHTETNDAATVLLGMFGLVDSPELMPVGGNELPLQPQEGEPFIGVSDVTQWLTLLDAWIHLRDDPHPAQEQLIQFIRRRLIESKQIIYWREAGSIPNGTAVQKYSDRDFLAGLQLVTHRNPPWSVLQRFEVALRTCISEGVESLFDPPTFVLWPRNYPQLSIDILPVVRITEVERRWAESRYSVGDPELSALQGIAGTIVAPWPSPPEDLVFCIDQNTYHPINPERHLAWLEHADSVMNGYPRLLIRLLKFWKYRRKVPIRSYYIELFVIRWLSQTHNIDGRNLIEVRSKISQTTTDVDESFFSKPYMNASEDLSCIICDLHHQLREPFNHGEMTGLLDMSTEDWWARSRPCAQQSEIATILHQLRECHEITTRACTAERQYEFAESISLWREFFRLPESEFSVSLHAFPT